MFFANDKFGVVAAPCPFKRCWRVKSHSFFPERDFAALEHDPQNDVTERSREGGANERSHARIGAHQLWNKKTRDDPRDCATNRDLVRNNKVFKVDKGGDEENGDKDPITDGDLPRKNSPDREKQKRRQQFDSEITEGDPRAAIGATSAEK